MYHMYNEYLSQLYNANYCENIPKKKKKEFNKIHDWLKKKKVLVNNFRIEQCDILSSHTDGEPDINLMWNSFLLHEL